MKDEAKSKKKTDQVTTHTSLTIGKTVNNIQAKHTANFCYDSNDNNSNNNTNTSGIQQPQQQQHHKPRTDKFCHKAEEIFPFLDLNKILRARRIPITEENLNLLFQAILGLNCALPF